MNLLKTFVASLAFASTAHAWKSVGHLLVARIAHDILENTSPDTITKVENVLKPFQDHFPSWTKAEGKHPMVECTTYADDIKYKGGGFQSPWHFDDAPYLDQGGSIHDFNFTVPDHNNTEAINGIVGMFNKVSGYKNNYIYQTILKNGPSGHTDNDSISTAMRFLIHYVGDAHQPLHGVARVDSKYPSGDKGGNDFPLPSHYGANELHAVWDSVIYEFHDNPNLPFSDNDWTAWGVTAK